MSDIERRVREAALTLHDAVVEAESAGYAIEWPRTASALSSIAISATGKAVAAAATGQASRPAPTKRQKS